MAKILSTIAQAKGLRGQQCKSYHLTHTDKFGAVMHLWEGNNC